MAGCKVLGKGKPSVAAKVGLQVEEPHQVDEVCLVGGANVSGLFVESMFSYVG